MVNGNDCRNKLDLADRKYKRERTQKRMALIFGGASLIALLMFVAITVPALVENPFEDDRYNEGYADGFAEGSPEKATIFLNLLDNTYVNWYWNDTEINGSQIVNYSVSLQFVPFRYLEYLVDEFRLIANWLDNATGESYYNDENDNNLPQLDFSCLESAEIFTKTLAIDCSGETSKNFSLYNEQIEDFFISNFDYKYTNYTTGLLDYFETDTENDNKSNVMFGFPLFSEGNTLFNELFILFEGMGENPAENHTIVDYMNNTFFPSFDEFCEPYRIHLNNNGDVFEVNMGNMVINQEENEFGQGDYLSYEKFLRSLDLNMNGTNYRVYSNGTNYIL